MLCYLFPEHCFVFAPEYSYSTMALPSLDLNIATQEEILKLEGIGQAGAAAIVAWRETHGYISEEDFQSMPEVPATVWEPLIGEGKISFTVPEADAFGQRSQQELERRVREQLHQEYEEQEQSRKQELEDRFREMSLKREQELEEHFRRQQQQRQEELEQEFRKLDGDKQEFGRCQQHTEQQKKEMAELEKRELEKRMELEEQLKEERMKHWEESLQKREEEVTRRESLSSTSDTKPELKPMAPTSVHPGTLDADCPATMDHISMLASAVDSVAATRRPPPGMSIPATTMPSMATRYAGLGGIATVIIYQHCRIPTNCYWLSVPRDLVCQRRLPDPAHYYAIHQCCWIPSSTHC